MNIDLLFQIAAWAFCFRGESGAAKGRERGYCGAGFRGWAGCGHVSGGGFGGAAAQQCKEHLRLVLRRQG